MLGAEEGSHRAVKQGLRALDVLALWRDEMFNSEDLKRGQLSSAEYRIKEEEAPSGCMYPW